MSDIVVIGSMNMDLVFSVERYPRAGETIIGRDFTITPGGKGANQAAAIGKLGGDVVFIAARGRDAYGDELVANLSESGVKVEHIVTIEGINTGLAAITVESDGENRIIVSPGANGKLSRPIVTGLKDTIGKAQVVLLQLEIPLETALKSIEIAHESGATVVLDPGPAQELPIEVYKQIDYILPNETELRQLCKRYDLRTEQQRAWKLLDLGVGGVIVTKGEGGSSFYSEKNYVHQAALQAKAVDTTGAGDAFAGGFAYGLQKGWDIMRTLKFASAVAGCSVTKMGAQDSLPVMAEVQEVLNVLDKGEIA